MFIVIQARAIPDHVRGYTDRFLTEVSSSLYVGNLSRKVAENLWDVLVEHNIEGGVVMILSNSKNEQGYEILLDGNQRCEIGDFDGLFLPVWDRKVASHAH